MTLPAYVLQLLTNTPASALSGQQARAIRLADGLRGFSPPAAGPNALEAPAAVSLTGKGE